jgi:hypothetical protein
MQASTARCHLSNLEYIHQTMLEPDPIVVDSRRYALIPTDGNKKCQMMLSGFDPASNDKYLQQRCTMHTLLSQESNYYTLDSINRSFFSTKLLPGYHVLCTPIRVYLP